ncbi:MAG: magnesium transporter [Acidobacteria bacterium]|nr:magnesium transporter [Acidobacteriota bacterium]
MRDIEYDKPWMHLEELIEASDFDSIRAFLDELPDDQTALALSRLDEDLQAVLFSQIQPDHAAVLLRHLPEVQAYELMEELSTEAAAAIVEALPSDEQADYVGELEPEQAEEILQRLDVQTAQSLRALAEYEDDEAGGLMVREYVAFPDSYTVKDAVSDLQSNVDKYRDYEVQYAYVVTEEGVLAGVLKLRDLLLAKPVHRITKYMVEGPQTVSDHATLYELRDFFDRTAFFGVPVTDHTNVLLGIVRRSSVEEALADQNADDYRKAQGIIQEELRTMPVITRSRRRLAWLSVNILLNVVAASVIAMYQDTLAQVIALTVFLPIISDMSGCSGNQAVAVSMRELALGVVRPSEVARVWFKEIAVGVLNGAALGLMIALVAYGWKGNPYLGLVVGLAMAINTMIAVSLGGTLPLIMRRLNMDPALASGPILTTVTDMFGFFLVLSMAAMMLPVLV